MAQLDNIIHQTVRLQIMSSLVSLDQRERVNFTTLRKLLKLTDGLLNTPRHCSKSSRAQKITIDCRQ